jgi:ATP-binding cassette subfamily F protein 3
LRAYGSAYVVVSHDRYFLDQISSRIIDVEHGRASSYTGNYSAYLVEREERREIQQRAYENQQHLIAKTEEFIRRNLAGQKTKQAKSRRTMLQKIERLDAVRPDQSSGDFRLKDVERAGNQVLTVIDATIGYEDKVLAGGIDFTLRRGECLGIIGPNGSGKTTFLKTILNKVAPLAGEVRWGTKVQVGYYAQQLDDLDPRNEIIMEMRRVAASTATAGELRGFLAKFLFTGDDVYKKVIDLSGGEKGRLALAKLIYSRVNVLVLDEPTNHLDIPSREALEEALDSYSGTIITISHDRYFLDRIATQILALDGEGDAEHYDGDYTQYHDWKAEKKREEAARAAKAKAVAPERARTNASEPEVKKATQPKPKSGKKDSKGSQQRSSQDIESEIAKSEARLTAISEELSSPKVARDRERVEALNREYGEVDERLKALYKEWETATAEGASA